MNIQIYVKSNSLFAAVCLRFGKGERLWKEESCQLLQRCLGCFIEYWNTFEFPGVEFNTTVIQT